MTLSDELGPAKVLEIHDRRLGLDAWVVVDNTACGPSIGGVRMATDVSADEVRRLARAMTLKNAAAGLPHGGGKAGIVADPGAPSEHKEALIRSFARAIIGLTDYVPGPDMGTDERCMGWVLDEIGRAVGLPRVLGGIPLDAIGATGYGLAAAADAAAELGVLSLDGARVVVQGFGAVGRHAARYLAERGCRLVAASDTGGAVYAPDGLELTALLEHKRTASVASFGGGEPLDPGRLHALECEIWIPAARPDVLDARRASELRARLVLQGANIPATPDAERILHERGVVNVPDFIANAGGVICAAVEYHGGAEATALASIAEKVRRNTLEVLETSRSSGASPRATAATIAERRVREAMSYRRR